MRHVIDGREYEAIHDGGTVWMVRRYQTPTNSADDEGWYTEQLVNTELTDPEAIIRLAIETNSWS